MAATMISDLNEMTTPDSGDFLPVVDSSAVETKKIDVDNLGERWLSTTTVNLNSVAAQTLYTVPVGKKLIVTRAVLRDGTQALNNGGASTFDIIRSDDAFVIMDNANIVAANHADSIVNAVLVNASASRYVTAGNSVQIKFDALFEDVCTASLDLFGYLVAA